MNSRKFLISLEVISLSMAISGCATVVSLTQESPKNKIFSGTIMHFDELKCAHGACVDLPFSFAADIVALPYSIPKTIANNISSDGHRKEQPKPEEAETDGAVQLPSASSD